MLTPAEVLKYKLSPIYIYKRYCYPLISGEAILKRQVAKRYSLCIASFAHTARLSPRNDALLICLRENRHP
jgi:hypothetical protein